MAAIRVTQIYVDYLADAASESDLRVTKVHAQALVRVIAAEAATDTLNLSDSAHEGLFNPSSDQVTNTESAGVSLDQAVSSNDTLALTDSAFDNLGRAVDTLTLSDEIDLAGSEYLHTVTDTLNLTEVGIGGKESAHSAADTLSLTDSVDVPAEAFDTLTLTELGELSNEAIDSLTPTEGVGTTVEFNTVTVDTLTLTEGTTNALEMFVGGAEELVTTDQVYDPATNTFTTIQTGLDEVAVSGGPYSVSGSDIINLTEVAIGYNIPSTATDHSAEDTLSLTDEARDVIALAAIDTLSLTEVADADISAVSVDTLTLTDSAVSAQDAASVAASDTLMLSESIGYTVDDNQIECSYSPFVGTSTDPNAPAPPPTTYTAAGATTGFRLQFPETGPVTDEVELRDPNFGNIDRLSFSRINHETRGGTLIIFADPTWPKIETLIFSFSGLKHDKADELQTFIADHLGLEIRLIDHEDRLWRGVITQPQNPKVEDSSGRFTMSFEFQGSKV